MLALFLSSHSCHSKQIALYHSHGKFLDSMPWTKKQESELVVYSFKFSSSSRYSLANSQFMCCHTVLWLKHPLYWSPQWTLFPKGSEYKMFRPIVHAVFSYLLSSKQKQTIYKQMGITVPVKHCKSSQSSYHWLMPMKVITLVLSPVEGIDW
jgi:hypothetical protein